MSQHTFLNGSTFVAGERRPVEVLEFRLDPRHMDEFLRVDHEVWTLGEAFLPEWGRTPFLSKEVWTDDSRPGHVTLVFVWESEAAWNAAAEPGLQDRLQAEFDRRFPHEITLIAAPHEDSNHGIHRVSRFERGTPGPTGGDT